MSMSGEERLVELGWLASVVVSVCCASSVLSSVAVMESELSFPLSSSLLAPSEELGKLDESES